MIGRIKRWLERQGFSERNAILVMFQALILAVLLLAVGVKIYLWKSQ